MATSDRHCRFNSLPHQVEHSVRLLRRSYPIQQPDAMRRTPMR